MKNKVEEKNTREVILQEALSLFAVKGYAAVSMRDIAAAVGIRVSSIYYYFSSKQELFDALVGAANDIKENLKSNFMNALSRVGHVEEDAFIQAGVFFLTGYLLNPQIAPLLQVLECERFHNAEADRIWKELLIGAPMEHQRAVFGVLKERGMLKCAKVDENELAAEYQAMVLLAYFTGDVKLLKVQLGDFYERVID